MIETLQHMGLTANEAKMYIVMLKVGPQPSGTLITKTGFQSSVVYHLIGTLMEKGLVNFVLQGNKKIYSPAPPENMRHLMEQKEKQLHATKKEFEALLPQLKKTREESHKDAVVQVYTGTNGMKLAFNDILEHSKEYIVYGGTGNFSRLLPFYKTYFVREKKERGITQKNLWFGDKKNSKNTKYLGSQGNLPFSVITYSDKVLINLFDTEPITSVTIESKTFAKALKNLFTDMWKKN